MSFDIYGNHLRPGYCEVHPDVHESFPCHYCRNEDESQECCRSGRCEVCNPTFNVRRV